MPVRLSCAWGPPAVRCPMSNVLFWTPTHPAPLPLRPLYIISRNSFCFTLDTLDKPKIQTPSNARPAWICALVLRHLSNVIFKPDKPDKKHSRGALVPLQIDNLSNQYAYPINRITLIADTPSPPRKGGTMGNPKILAAREAASDQTVQIMDVVKRHLRDGDQAVVLIGREGDTPGVSELLVGSNMTNAGVTALLTTALQGVDAAVKAGPQVLPDDAPAAAAAIAQLGNTIKNAQQGYRLWSQSAVLYTALAVLTATTIVSLLVGGNYLAAVFAFSAGAWAAVCAMNSRAARRAYRHAVTSAEIAQRLTAELAELEEPMRAAAAAAEKLRNPHGGLH